MNTTTITIREEDHEKLNKIAEKNTRKLIDQFHVIMKDLEESKS